MFPLGDFLKYLHIANEICLKFKIIDYEIDSQFFSGSGHIEISEVEEISENFEFLI